MKVELENVKPKEIETRSFEIITEEPGEVESLLFCLQTGIGVGVIAFIMGRFVERKKWMKDDN